MIRFQPAAESDAPTITELRRRIWDTTYRGIYPDAVIDDYDRPRHLARDRMRINDPSYQVYLIEDGEMPVGYLYFQHSTGVHIQSLYLLPAYQHRGIGRIAFGIVQACCNAHALTEFTCNCNAHNQNARGFYEHMGGVVIAEDCGHANRQEDQLTYRFTMR